MSKHWLRSQITRGAQSIDRNITHEKGVGSITGFAVLTKGLINEDDARDWEFDDISLQQILDLGNKSNQGIKSRFGHPNQSGDALGTFLGRAKNFRREGDVIRADLFFDKTAYETPDGNLANYVLGLAETDPEAFGTSMVFDAQLECRVNPDGTKQKDKDGNVLPALVRFTSLFAVDVVDDPAANKGMFGKFLSGNTQLSAEMTSFLDKFLNHPEAVEKTIAFLERYSVNCGELEDRKKTKCQACGAEFDFMSQPGADSGSVKCPKCGAMVDESGAVVSEVVTKKEGVEMEIKTLTLEALKSERSDLVGLLHKEGLEEGKVEALKAERARVASILEKCKEFEGDKIGTLAEVAKTSISDGDTLEAAENKLKDKKLALLTAAAPAAAGPGAEGSEKKELSLEEKCKQEFEASKDLQAEFKELSTYTAFKKYEAMGRIKILKK